jgi:hypothetical protein
MTRVSVTSDNSVDTWTSLTRSIHACSQALADPHLCLEAAQDLRGAYLDRLQKCLYQWEVLADRIPRTIPLSQRWAFDRLGNVLRATAQTCHHTASRRGRPLAEELRSGLVEAEQLAQLVASDLIWSASIIPFSFEHKRPRIAHGVIGTPAVILPFPPHVARSSLESTPSPSSESMGSRLRDGSASFQGTARVPENRSSDDEDNTIGEEKDKADRPAPRGIPQLQSELAAIREHMLRYGEALQNPALVIEADSRLRASLVSELETLLKQVEDLHVNADSEAFQPAFGLLNRIANSLRICAMAAKHPPTDGSARATIQQNLMDCLDVANALLDSAQTSSFLPLDEGEEGFTETSGREDSMQAKAQIFLSYAREDEVRVAHLYKRLTDAGFKPWMDTKDILPGEVWKSRIQEAIRHSDFFLVCLSANSVSKRGFLQRELRNALDLWQERLDSDIYLIPVRLEACEVPESLSDFQWANLFEPDGWIRLVKAIQVGMERLRK